MLTISYGEQAEDVIEVNSKSSAFVACVATLANAFIGVRPHVPESSVRTKRTQLLVGGIYAAGFGVSREIISFPAPRIIRLYDVDTGETARHLHDVSTVVLSLDTATVTSTERVYVGGVVYELIVKQFIDAPNIPAVSILIELRRVSDEDKPHRLRLDYGVDDTAVNEYLGGSDRLTARHYNIKQSLCDEEHFSVIVDTVEQRLRYNVQVERSHPFASSAISWNEKEGGCVTSVTFDFSTIRHHQLSTHWWIGPETDNQTLGSFSSRLDFDGSGSEHLVKWNTLWRDHGVTVNSSGDPVELGIKYAVFQLLQHGIGSMINIHGLISPARGLTSTYHSGATFFDTELHKCIFWIWNDPSIAKAFIDYRYNFIENAVEFAKSTGFSGARFPEASNDLGAENGPHYVLSYPDPEIRREWSVDEVLHISADVCYALSKYWTATGDDTYMESRGYRMMVESARFAVSAFKWSESKKGYVVNSVMGPDEYHYHVDNSFFTNYMLRWCIRLSLSLVGRSCFPHVTTEDIELWQTIADHVYLPWITVDGVSIPEEFDGYASLPETQLRVDKTRGPQFADETEREYAEKLQNFSSRLVKQADIVLLMSLFPDDFSDIVKRTAFNYYEPRTVHESSLSYGPHAVVAAHLGETLVCADFIERASRYNLDFTPVADYSNGLHLSAYAGAWQGLVEGLSGLNIKDGQLSFRPQLPSHWASYHFTLHFRGQRLKVSILGDGELDVRSGDVKLTTEFSQDGSICLKERCV